ncbi:TadE/TadG family type IV pilus assembly protein [Paenibacillus dauci]|uniref:TadE/TadG family type IV pilus assembly protein n=1 Tax=Paenibacillus dauci TaxID=1567106 RepID=UPI000696FA94|nr:TadE family protein [Paenibacillus dauci]
MQTNRQTTDTKQKEITLQPIGILDRQSRFVAQHSSQPYHRSNEIQSHNHHKQNQTYRDREIFRIIPFPSNLKREERGSIVLEAAMVLPIFLFVAVFLVYLVQMTLVSTALNNVTSDTARYVATHMYPVQKASEAMGESSVMPKLSLSELASQYEGAFPSPINEWMMEAASGGDAKIEQLKNQAAAAVLDAAIKPLIQQIASDNRIDYNRIHITEVTVPDLSSKTNPYFGIEIEYELPFRVPLIFKPIVLQSRSTERLWIGDTGEFGEAAQKETAEQTGVKVVSVPQPAHPESMISIKATAPPSSVVSLEIRYKSGESTAKGLGQAVADAEGNIDWTWKIPSSATAGWATYVLTTADGQKIRGTFQIAPYDGRPVIADS